MKPRILVFCDFYLPGFKAGGGMWTVVNLVDRFYDRYDFFVVTRNYDSRDDTEPYTSVRTGEWNSVGNAKVYYATSELINQHNFASLIRDVAPAAVFLNSVFCTLSVKFLMLRRRGRVADLPVILAPCGELSKAALSIRGYKKQTFLKTAGIAGLFRGVLWKASTELEQAEIKSVVGKNTEIMIAPDLPPREILPNFDPTAKARKDPGAVTFCFVSRVVRKKNLHFLLQAMKPLSKGKITLKIVGPLEDEAYWNECREIIETFPVNINVEIVGGVRYEAVLNHLIASHFFVLPTLNENFGYVFVEAMAAGCPLVISDRTIWNEIAEHGAGYALPIDASADWTSKLQECVEMPDTSYRRMSAAAREYSVAWLNDPDVQNATANVLRACISGDPD